MEAPLHRRARHTGALALSVLALAAPAAVAAPLVQPDGACFGPPCATFTPPDPPLLQVGAANTPTIRLSQSGGTLPAASWDIRANETSFLLLPGGAPSPPFLVRAAAPPGSLAVDDNGNVGVGTFDPASALSVVRGNGTARLLVEEDKATAATRTLGELRNNGPAQLRFTSTEAGSEAAWLAGGGDGRRFVVRPADPTAPTALSLAPDGGAIVGGAISQRVPAASAGGRTAVDTAAIANLIAHLPLSTWRYPGDPDHALHLGPTGEDFQSAFHLGASSTALSPTDMAGVALAGVKAILNAPSFGDPRVLPLQTAVGALTTRVKKDEARIRALESGNAKLKRTTKSLSSAVASLERRVRTLSRGG